MSIDAAFTRIAELQSLLGGAAAPAAVPQTAATAAPAGDQFAQMLRTASLPGAGTAASTVPGALGATATIAPAAAPAGGTPAARMVALAQGEVGQAEQPPGSNDSPRIAQYRSATAGAPGPGPWCAYFTSWLAR